MVRDFSTRNACRGLLAAVAVAGVLALVVTPAGAAERVVLAEHFTNTF